MNRYPFRRKSYAVSFDGKFLDCLKSRPSKRWLRWPVGRAVRPPSILVGWFVTDDQIIKGADAELVDLDNGTLVRIESSISIPGIFQTMSTDPRAIMNAIGISEQWFFRSRNKRQGWLPDGTEIAS